MTFSANPGQGVAHKSVSVQNAADGRLDPVAIGIGYRRGSGWLTVQAGGSGNSQTLQNRVTVAGLSVDNYEATVWVSDGQTPQHYTVALTVVAPSVADAGPDTTTSLDAAAADASSSRDTGAAADVGRDTVTGLDAGTAADMGADMGPTSDAQSAGRKDTAPASGRPLAADAGGGAATPLGPNSAGQSGTVLSGGCTLGSLPTHAGLVWGLLLSLVLWLRLTMRRRRSLSRVR